MGWLPWSELNALYQLARNNDSSAWIRLDAEVAQRIVRWLRVRRKIVLPVNEIEDISHCAFEETTLRFSRIHTWPKAWTYTCKVALGLSIKRLTSIQENLNDALGRFSEPLDSMWSRPFEEIDLRDELQNLAHRLNSDQEKLFFAIINSFIEGSLTIAYLANRLRLSEATVKRRLRRLKHQ